MTSPKKYFDAVGTDKFIDSLSVLVAIYDADNRIVWANKAYRKAVGLSLKQLTGRKCCSPWSNSTLCGKCRFFKNIKEKISDEPALTSGRRKKDDGSHDEYQSSQILPIKDSKGGIIGTWEVIVNISERLLADGLSQQADSNRTRVLLELGQMTNASLKEITDFALEESVKLTQSKIGYLAFLNDDESVLTMHSWSKEAMAQCAIKDKPIHYPVVDAGLWGEAVRQRKAIITNDYAAPNRWKKGIPKGHVKVVRHMNVPIFRGNRIAVVAGVGNKDKNYTEADVKQLTLIMQGMLRLIERKQVEDELKRTNKLHSIILDNSTVGIAFVRDRKFEWVNSRMPELFHLTLEELQGASTRIIYPTDKGYRKVGDDIYSILAQGKKGALEIEMQRGDGTTFWCRLEGNALDPARVHAGSIWIWEDITERKRTEELLKTSEENYRTIFNSVNEAIFIHDADTGAILDVNKKMTDIYGFTRSEACNMSVGDVSSGDPPYSLEEAVHLITKTHKEGPQLFEWKAKNKAGEVFWVEVNLQEAIISGTKRIIAVVRDIQKRKTAEEELLRIGKLQSAILNNSTAGIAFVRNRIFEWVNPKMLELFHRQLDEMQGASTRIIYPSKEAYEKEGETTYAAFAEGKSTVSELEMLRGDGSTFWARIEGNALDASRPQDGSIWMLEDITERILSDRLLMESEERYRAIFENTGTLSIIVDEDTTIILANSEFVRLSGYKKEEIQGKMSWTQFVAPEDLDKVLKYAERRKIDPKNTPTSYEFKAVNRNGETFQYMIHIGVIPGTRQRIASLIDITHRKKAEEALKASEEKFLKAFNFSPAIMAISTVEEGRFIDVNEAFLEAFRFKRDEIIGKTVYELGLYVDPNQRRHIVEEMRNSGYVRNLDVLFRKNTGELIYALFSSTLMESGNEQYMLTQVVDITERHLAEEKLKRSEQLYRTFIDANTDMVFLKDEHFRHLVANKVLAAFFDKPLDSIPGKSDFELMPEYAARRCRETDTEAIADMSVVSSEEIVGGQHYETLKFPVDLGQGRIGVGGFIRNISRRKRAEEALKEREEFLTSVVENIPAMVFIKDARDFRFVRFNKAGETLLGIRREELMGKRDEDLFPKEQARFFNQKDREVLAKGTMCDIYEEPIDTRNGRRILHTKKMPILDKNGNPAFILGISEDITEQLRLESQLRQSQKLEAVGRLAGGIAHDFNNMLFVITGYAEMALSRIKPDDPLRDYIDEIHATAKRSADVTRQLLAFARSQVINPQVISLNLALESMLKMIKRLIGEDIELVIRPAEDLWLVKMDPSQIDQILANLCINARDAISGAGKITVETSNVILDEEYCLTQTDVLPGEYVLLSVTDTGCGIGQGELPMIFEPFYTTKEHGKGTGLGLPSVYGAVKQNDGFIVVHSELSKGTCFKIYLPRHVPVLTEIAEKTKPITFGNNSEIILVVDDEASIADMIQKMLCKLEYDVLKANTPSEAMKLAAGSGQRIDLLLTDIIMPEMNGCELAEKLLTLHPKMKVLLMSGYPADEIQNHGLADNQMQFIQKPVSLEILAEKIRSILNQESPDREMDHHE